MQIAMNNSTGSTSTERDSSPKRVLNVEIPESVYWHVRQCATESRMSMKDFMAIFCNEAKAIDTPVENQR
jgi:hypothetical protein